MRAGIGLLSILIVAALVFYLTFGTKAHPGYDATVLEKGRTAAQEASQISGKTQDNTPIQDTFQMEEVDSGGQFKRLKVISITPQTPMDTIYGLKPGDEITRVGDMGVSDNNDPGLAKALVYEAYGRNQPLVVLRNDEQMMLTPTASPLSKMSVSNITRPLAPAIPPVAIPGSQTVPTH